MRICFALILAGASALVSASAACAGQSLPSNHSGWMILEQARAAEGPSARAVKTLDAQGRIRTSGLSGPWRQFADLGDGRYVVIQDLGIFRLREGYDGSDHWRQDPSGGVHRLNSLYARQAAATDAWLTRRAWLLADADGADVGAARTRIDGNRGFVVLDATPHGGLPVEMWFDASTSLLRRTVRKAPISTQTVRYDDYRRVLGMRLPFRIDGHDSSGPGHDVVIVRRYRLTSAGHDAFTAPQPPDDTSLAAESTTLPLDVDGFITVEASLNGRKFRFIVDTGGHDIITPAVAKALGFRPVGAGTSGGAGAGHLDQQYVRVDRVDIGAATMRDQHFYVLDFPYDTVEQGADPPLAGLLGLELFERFAVRLDYPAKTMTLTKLDRYTHRGPGTSVPITFSDDSPLIDGSIDGAPGSIAVDTGNGGTMLIQQVWARAHGMAERLKAGYEMVSYGSGGESRNWASRIQSVEIAGHVIAHPIARYAEDEAGAFSSWTEAANIGTDILANFAVDFDYGRGEMWFDYKPGRVPEPFSRSGVRAIKDRPAAFVVTLVTPGSPGAVAGVAKGDEILVVDGVGVRDISGNDLSRRFKQPPGTPVEFIVRRGTHLHTLTVILADLLP